MPAAAVIPALLVYIKIVAVKKSVVDLISCGGRFLATATDCETTDNNKLMSEAGRN